MAAPDPNTTEWVPVWNPTAIGPMGPPGPTGPAGAAVAAAKYWLVEPFGGLINARALNSLGTGYVRSTAGEPSVVPTIPLTDTTGILPDDRLTSNVALKNIDNQFTAVQTLPAFSRIKGNPSLLWFENPLAPVNIRTWRWLSYSDGMMRLERLTDDASTILSSYNFHQDGTLFSFQFNGGGTGLTNLNASQLASGTVPLPRLGTNAPNNTLFLRGDNTWQPPPAAAAFPSGLIVIAVAPCPPGWTRINWDGFFLRSGPVVGAIGGAASHSHGPGSFGVPAHGHGPGTSTLSGDHVHSFEIHVALNTGNDSGGLLNVDGGSSGNMSRGPHTHPLNIDLGATTNGGGNHSHETTVPNAGGMGVTGVSDAQSNLPPFIDIYYCQKN